MQKVVITLSSQIIIHVIGLLTGIIVARHLGPVGRGELAMILTWTMVIVHVGDLGIPVAFVYSSSRIPGQRRQLLIHGVLIALAQWIILSFVGYILLSSILDGQRKEMFYMAIVYLVLIIPINLIARYANAIQQGAGNFLAFNLIRTCVPTMYLIFLAYFLASDTLTLKNTISANLLSNAVTLLAVLVFIFPKLLLNPEQLKEKSISLKNFLRDLKYGASAHIGNMQPLSSLRLDILALSVLLPASELGLYMIAVVGMELLKAQGIAIGMVILPKVASKTTFQEKKRIIIRYSMITFFLVIPAAIIAMIWSRELIVMVYGPAFQSAAPVLQLMVISGTAAAFYRVLADGLRGIGHPLQSSVVELAGLALGVTCFILLVPDMGLTGAAISHISAHMLALLLTVGFIYVARGNRKMQEKLLKRTEPNI